MNEEEKKVIEALRTVKEYCKRINCGECVLDGYFCLSGFAYMFPNEWDIPESEESK